MFVEKPTVSKNDLPQNTLDHDVVGLGNDFPSEGCIEFAEMWS